MVEKILGDRQAKDIFFSAMLTGILTEKQAASVMEKDASLWKDILDTVGGGLGFAGKTISKIPPTLGWTALLGASAGGLGAMAYDAMNERVSQEDPEKKFNDDLEILYKGKKREIEDAKWMARMRAKRDKLVREGKKMDPDTYKKEFDDLVSGLDERKGMA